MRLYVDGRVGVAKDRFMNSSASFKYIYGPVESWGIGKSLGIDPLSDREKICNMDCIYCQLGKTDRPTDLRKDYVSAQVIFDEVKSFFVAVKELDCELTENIKYITFSGRGEPTLATNLGEMIKLLRKIRREKIAVITNSTFFHLPSVCKDLALADLVVAKLDACDQASLESVDKVMPETRFESILQSIKDFRHSYKGKLVIRVMFVEENFFLARHFVEMIRDIQPDEIQLNTPLRPSAAKPLNAKEILKIKSFFKGMPVVSVFDRKQKPSKPFDRIKTIQRHGNYTKILSRRKKEDACRPKNY